MTIVTALLWALLAAWMLQITLAVGTAIYLIVHGLMRRDRDAAAVLGTGVA